MKTEVYLLVPQLTYLYFLQVLFIKVHTARIQCLDKGLSLRIPASKEWGKSGSDQVKPGCLLVNRPQIQIQYLQF